MLPRELSGLVAQDRSLHVRTCSCWGLHYNSTDKIDSKKPHFITPVSCLMWPSLVQSLMSMDEIKQGLTKSYQDRPCIFFSLYFTLCDVWGKQTILSYLRWPYTRQEWLYVVVVFELSWKTWEKLLYYCEKYKTKHLQNYFLQTWLQSLCNDIAIFHFPELSHP